MTSFPLGARGEHPVFFPCRLPWDRLRELTSIPGIVRAPGGLRCTWDVAHSLASWLEVPPPRAPLESLMTDEELTDEVLKLPGIGRYHALGLGQKLRPYQKDGAVFLARRAYAMNSDPMRSGKSVQALTASVLVDARRTLIVAPALAKWVWADEVGKWLQEEALILEGRGGDIARRYCLACEARGYKNGQRCDACKMRNGQARGYALIAVEELQASPTGAWTCKKHLDVARPGPGPCPRCIEELHDAIEKARYVIVNYDLLVAQKTSDAAGRAYFRDDLQGWGPALARHHFDLCIADESHQLRGWTSDAKKKGTTRREKFCQITDNIERVWALTGTPIYGYVRDLWGQLDAISKGAMSGPDSRLPFAFHSRYCDGHKDDYGWKADGRTHFADTELPARLSYVKIQRPRSQILVNMPPKVRQTIRIDDTRPSKRVARFSSGDDNTGKITKLLKSTFEAKVDTVVENVVGEIAQGEKVVVFTLLRQSAERLAKAIEKEAKKSENRTRMREVDLKIWLAHGDASTQARFEMARTFREHGGAGVFVTTIDAVQVAVSLKGASSVHFAELHWQPSAMLQAEDRPYEVGVAGLNIVYYIVRGSVDEHIEQVILPKVDTLARVVAEKGATEMNDALAGNTQESLEQLLTSLTAHLKLREES